MPPKARRNNNKKKKKKAPNSRTSSTSTNEEVSRPSGATAARLDSTSSPPITARFDELVVSSSAGRTAVTLGFAGCAHGGPNYLLGPDHPYFAVTAFLMDNIQSLPTATIAKQIRANYPTCELETLVEILASFGTTTLLLNERPELLDVNARKIAHVLLVFEVWVDKFKNPMLELPHDEHGDSAHLAYLLKDNEIAMNLNSQRNLLRFYAKRIPCHCLENMKQAAKEATPEKVGDCRACGKTQRDAELLNCSACGVIKYCSKECQVKDWPSHKEKCKKWRFVKEREAAKQNQTSSKLEHAD